MQRTRTVLAAIAITVLANHALAQGTLRIGMTAELLAQVRNAFDPAEQTRLLQKVHEKYVDDALFLMVTHDVNPRAISPKVKGFIQAQNWFQDFSPIWMVK
jgi:ABC-type transport system substrate-binding protein